MSVATFSRPQIFDPSLRAAEQAVDVEGIGVGGSAITSRRKGSKNRRSFLMRR